MEWNGGSRSGNEVRFRDPAQPHARASIGLGARTERSATKLCGYASLFTESFS